MILGRCCALDIETVELIDGALEQVVALVMLDDSSSDIVELDRVGQRTSGPFAVRIVVGSSS